MIAVGDDLAFDEDRSWRRDAVLLIEVPEVCVQAGIFGE